MIARLARITGIPPGHLAGLDPELYLAVETDALGAPWSTMHELAANQVELLAAIVQMLARLLGPFTPLHLPRPGAAPEAVEGDGPRRIVIRPSEMADALGARKRGVAR